MKPDFLSVRSKQALAVLLKRVDMFIYYQQVENLEPDPPGYEEGISARIEARVFRACQEISQMNGGEFNFDDITNAGDLSDAVILKETKAVASKLVAALVLNGGLPKDVKAPENPFKTREGSLAEDMIERICASSLTNLIETLFSASIDERMSAIVTLVDIHKKLVLTFPDAGLNWRFGCEISGYPVRFHQVILLDIGLVRATQLINNMMGWDLPIRTLILKYYEVRFWFWSLWGKLFGK